MKTSIDGGPFKQLKVTRGPIKKRHTLFRVRKTEPLSLIWLTLGLRYSHDGVRSIIIYSTRRNDGKSAVQNPQTNACVGDMGMLPEMEFVCLLIGQRIV